MHKVTLFSVPIQVCLPQRSIPFCRLRKGCLSPCVSLFIPPHTHAYYPCLWGRRGLLYGPQKHPINRGREREEGVTSHPQTRASLSTYTKGVTGRVLQHHQARTSKSPGKEERKPGHQTHRNGSPGGYQSPSTDERRLTVVTKAQESVTI